MEVEDALAFVDELVFDRKQKRMTDVERAVVWGAWQGKAYKEIQTEDRPRVKLDHLMKNTGPNLWKILSGVLRKM